ncbi:hypothetical protein AYI69_g2254 [Smittium culicis]|uniref:CCHC-type domain-containing protein n=1 Tax=Smittium culicis TaxID=133412 RepID=A0A1R1YN68_9FUNG|nr:hypothetical protein AYI69_g2254 [Smittium culicis]
MSIESSSKEDRGEAKSPNRHVRFLEPEIFTDSEEESDVWIRRYELYARKSNWNDVDKRDFMELYLGGKPLRWFERVKEITKNWESLKVRQKDDEEVEDLADRLEKLFSKVKLMDEKVKLRCLLNSINPKYQRSILKNRIETYSMAIVNACEEEQLVKACEFDSENPKTLVKSSIQVKKNFICSDDNEDGIYESLIKRFDQLNLNFLKLANSQKNVTSQKSTYINHDREHLQKIGACFYCKEIGHISKDCPKGSWNQSRNLTEEPDKKVEASNYKSVGCIEVEKNKEEMLYYDLETQNRCKVEIIDRESGFAGVEILGLSNEFEKQIYTAEKRKKTETVQASPEIRSELTQLIKKCEIAKEVKSIEEDSTTNCKSIVKIFDKNYSAIIDTGAACSVISEALMECIGLEVESKTNQIIVTADGKKHYTMGIIEEIPISIANINFNADLLEMKSSKETLILGTDWLKTHNALIDIRHQELVLPLEDHDVVLSLSTTKNRDFLNGIVENDENEVFGIGKLVSVVNEDSSRISMDPEILELNTK